MKMTKTAVAVAIAGIAAAPMIASADTTLSGVIEINVNGFAGDKEGADVGDAGDPAVGTGDVNFNINAEHELDSGLIGYGNIRVDMDQLSNQNDEVGTADSTYVGMKGGFGDFRLGEIPLAVEYAQVANDIYDFGSEINGGLSYTGDFGPAGVILNFSPENNSADGQLGIGAKFAVGGFSIGVGAEQRGEDDDMIAAIGATFAVAGASVAAHYAMIDPDAGDESSIAAAQVGYGFGGVSAKLTFQMFSVDNDAIDDATAIRLDLGYGLGGGLDLSTRITSYDEPESQDFREGTEWRIQLAKSF